MTRFDCISTSQRGSALIIALVFLLAMTLIGVTAMQGTNQQESMAGNMRNHNLAFQAAEAALRVGERRVAPPAVAPLPAAFNNTIGNGLITLQAPGTAFQAPNTDVGAFWMNFNWNLSQLLPPNTLSNVIQQPSYVIEYTTLDPILCPLGAAVVVGSGVECYRITARGLGGTTDAVAIVQSTYAR